MAAFGVEAEANAGQHVNWRSMERADEVVLNHGRRIALVAMAAFVVGVAAMWLDAFASPYDEVGILLTVLSGVLLATAAVLAPLVVSWLMHATARHIGVAPYMAYRQALHSAAESGTIPKGLVARLEETYAELAEGRSPALRLRLRAYLFVTWGVFAVVVGFINLVVSDGVQYNEWMITMLAAILGFGLGFLLLVLGGRLVVATRPVVQAEAKNANLLLQEALKRMGRAVDEVR